MSNNGFMPMDDGIPPEDGAAAPAADMGGDGYVAAGNAGGFGGSAELGSVQRSSVANEDTRNALITAMAATLCSILIVSGMAAHRWLLYETAASPTTFDFWLFSPWHACVKYSGIGRFQCHGFETAQLSDSDFRSVEATRVFAVFASIFSMVAMFLSFFVLLLAANAPGTAALVANFPAFNAARATVMGVALLSVGAAFMGMIAMSCFRNALFVRDSLKSVEEQNFEGAEKINGRLGSAFGAFTTGWIFQGLTGAFAFYQWMQLAN